MIGLQAQELVTLIKRMVGLAISHAGWQQGSRSPTRRFGYEDALPVEETPRAVHREPRG